MSFQDTYKITAEERLNKGVSGLPDTPNMTTAAIQERFDTLGNLSIDKFNALVDAASDTVDNSDDKFPTNKAVIEFVEEMGGGDMLRAVYDTDRDGVVDNAENSQKLNNLPYTYFASAESVSTVASNLTSEASARASADSELTSSIDLVSARLETLVPEGTQTEGNTELIDIRTGADGTSYVSAGASVRGQVGDLKNGVKYSTSYLLEMIHGQYWVTLPVTITAGKNYTVKVSAVHASSSAQFKILDDADHEYNNIMTPKKGVYTFTATNNGTKISFIYMDGTLWEGSPADWFSWHYSLFDVIYNASAWIEKKYTFNTGKVYTVKVDAVYQNYTNCLFLLKDASNNEYARTTVNSAGLYYVTVDTNCVLFCAYGWTGSVWEGALPEHDTDFIRKINVVNVSGAWVDRYVPIKAGNTYTVRIDTVVDTSNSAFLIKDSSNVEYNNTKSTKKGLYKFVAAHDANRFAAYGWNGSFWEGESLDYVEPGITIKTIKVELDGSGRYTDVKSALDSITDNSKTNQYIVELGIGDFDISESEIPYLGMKNYVTIKGQGKGLTRVLNKKSSSTYNNTYSVFDPAYYTDAIEYACLKDMTLIVQGGKCPVHIDTDYAHFINGGKIELINLSLFDAFDYTSTSVDPAQSIMGLKVGGGVNCGVRSGQSIIVKDCDSNGTIYAHTLSNQDKNIGAYFEVTGCVCERVSLGDLLSGSPDKAVIRGNKIKHVCFDVNGNYGGISKQYSWSIDFIGNEVDIAYGYLTGSSDIYAFWDTYFNGKIGRVIPGLHLNVVNKSGSSISRGTFVEEGDYIGQSISGGYVVPYSGGKIFGFAMENISDSDMGIIQNTGVIRYQIGESVNMGDGLKFNGTNFVKSSDAIDMVAMESGNANDTIFMRFAKG